MDIDDAWQELGRIVKDVSRVVREHTVELIAPSSPLEKLLREALSDEDWGCSTSIMSGIAGMTYSRQNMSTVMNAVWAAIEERPACWRRKIKGLNLLEYLLKHGNEAMAEEIGNAQYVLRPLTTYSWVNAEGTDKGMSVREKSKEILELINNAALLEQKRDEAKRNKNKYIGISSSGYVNGNVSSQYENFHGSRTGGWDHASPFDCYYSSGRSEERTPRISQAVPHSGVRLAKPRDPDKLKTQSGCLDIKRSVRPSNSVASSQFDRPSTLLDTTTSAGEPNIQGNEHRTPDLLDTYSPSTAVSLTPINKSSGTMSFSAPVCYTSGYVENTTTTAIHMLQLDKTSDGILTDSDTLDLQRERTQTTTSGIAQSDPSCELLDGILSFKNDLGLATQPLNKFKLTPPNDWEAPSRVKTDDNLNVLLQQQLNNLKL